MKKFIWALLIIPALLMLLQPVTAEEESPTACIYYFYGIGCPHCENVEPYLENISSSYPSLNIRKFEVYHNKSNADMMSKFFDAYNVPQNQRGIPILFLEDKYLVGDTDIIRHMESEIKDNPQSQCPSASSSKTSFSLPLVLGTALVDSINPCAIAVLIILMASLLLLGDTKKAFKSGLAFVIGIYLIYFLFGIGLFAFFKEIVLFLGEKAFTGISSILRTIIGLFAVFIGLANIKDFFWYGKAFLMEIPVKWRPSMKKLLGNVTSPAGAFVAGLFVSAFELPCTGGPYLFAVGYLAHASNYISLIPVLLLYNLVFILPLLLILLLLYFGKISTMKLEQWRQNNLRILHLITGIIMLALGLLVMLRIV